MQAIWDFIAEDNENAANKVISELLDEFEKLADWPGKGHVRPDLTDRKVLFWPAGSYLIVYHRDQKPLQVVAVLHGARDIPAVIRGR